jgi:hypothetical protein
MKEGKVAKKQPLYPHVPKGHEKNSAVVVMLHGRSTMDHRPTLAESQQIVGGYIELVKARSSKTQKVVTLVVNEEGKLQNLPVNQAITDEYGPSIRGGYGGYIVGNVIVLTGWQTVG